MDKEYPSEEDLNKIRTWQYGTISEDIFERNVEGLIEFIRDTWHWPDWGFSFRQQKETGAWKLALHTGGWSGNESIISALEENFIFWSMFWKLTRRGGHYYFDTEMTKKKWARNAC